MRLKILKKASNEKGQVLSEYVIALVMFTLIALILLTFTYFFSLHGGRLIDFIGIEYP